MRRLFGSLLSARLQGVVARAFALVALLSLLVALAGGLAAGLWLQNAYVGDNMRLVAQQAAYSVEVPLVFGDRKAAGDALTASLGGDVVSRIIVRDADGQTFVTMDSPDDQGLFDAIVPDGLRPTPVEQQVTSGGATIGSVRVLGSSRGVGALLIAAMAAGLFGVAIMSVGTALIVRRLNATLVAPLNAVADVANDVRNERRFDLRAPIDGLSEVRSLAGNINALLDQLQEWQGQTESQQQALLYRASIDPLSGLPNRATFLDRLRETLGVATRTGDRFAVLFLDGNRFKDTNDRYGHAAGDRVITEVANRISPLLRVGDVAARVGGDEFAVLVNHLEQPGDASSVAGRIREAMVTPVAVGDNAHADISLSIGIALFPEDGADADTLLRIADERMYHEKTATRH